MKSLMELDPNTKLLHDMVDSIPDKGFDKNAEQRRNALHNKIDAVEKTLSENDSNGATNKLQNDIKDKLEKWLVDYEPDNPTQPTKAEALSLVDEITNRLSIL
ncbi:hypothetical protein Mtc_0307 [Methanocella conradii HZ254]|uniref:Uncharacterized protein n=1 Tax=Methanocella conradii (strain DSM 24694 / JCM 17849 / CGMCC 1.5162 / HZ254) TaxID=1041930 RepID=H8I975_METCZ|nr:hypothetical protein [Methanocella conradii]AFC99078.1 hypothetical protein Mtc_0307 [Methanocella conradii HZ254]